MLVQIPASMGIFGCIAFAIHVVSLGIVCFKKFSLSKLMLLAVPFMILGLSLTDNFLFYPHFQIFYGAFLALAEKQIGSGKKTSKAPT